VLAILVTAALLGAVSLTLVAMVARLVGLIEGEPHFAGKRTFDRIRIIRFLNRSEGTSRVRVTGPRVKLLTCQICMGNIKENSNFTYCKCGRPFHNACLSRTGFCPYCEESYEGDLTDLSQEKERRANQTCPVCGMIMPPDSARCECGAIFLEEGESFQCPSCGLIMAELEGECPRCGEIFETFDIVNCPVCGSYLSAHAEICECGALIGGCCPECGAPLGPEDMYCISCGAEFEFI
jgi:ribosomal protein S27AE